MTNYRFGFVDGNDRSGGVGSDRLRDQKLRDDADSAASWNIPTSWKTRRRPTAAQSTTSTIGHSRASSRRREQPTTATQNAQNATKAAGDAETAANDAVHRADSLDSVVKGLDNYKSMADVTVNFGFDKAVLTRTTSISWTALPRSLDRRRATFSK